MTASKDFYEVLELTPDATQENIQAAYYKMVRKHPPEKDEQGFQQVQRAYEVLSNKESRREYDETRATDPETRGLIEQGRDLLEKGDHGAIEPLKRALVRQNDSSLIRDLFVQALMLREEFDEAENQAIKVLSNEPNNSVYNMRMGDILTSLDRHEEARGYFQRAVSCDQESPMPLVKLAYCLNITGEMSGAVKQLYKGIKRDGIIDFNDFIYFHTLCRIYTLNQELDKLSEIHVQIKEILPPDKETRAFVAWSYYVDAVTLAQLGNFDAAVRFIDEASQIDSTLPELSEMQQHIHSLHDVANELKILRNDESIMPVLRYSSGLLASSNIFGADNEAEKAFKQITEMLEIEILMVGSRLPSSIYRLKTKYPAIAELLSEFIQYIECESANAIKRYMRLVCPKCGDETYTSRPTLKDKLIMDGEYFDYINIPKSYRADENRILESKAEKKVLSCLTFTCKKCDCTYDGHLRRIRKNTCFVVTAACGDENSYPVIVLRRFREIYLDNNILGRLLSKIYNIIGPIAAIPIKHIAIIRIVTYKLVKKLADIIDDNYFE